MNMEKAAHSRTGEKAESNAVGNTEKHNELLAYLYVVRPFVHLYTPNNNKQSSKTCL